MPGTLLLSGNEAVAKAAFDAGAKIGTGYPGTPSTETLEAFARFDGVYAEWCTNEKVALEVALGASAAGKRCLVTMKHVGLNVAADPLFTASYTGVNGGLVILVADDPGMYSSQNEQDTHYYAQGAQVLCLDPADSQEAYDFTLQAFDLSEKLDTPVIVRSTVRVSHTRCPVKAADLDLIASDHEPGEYKTDPSKWVMMPAYAKPRHKVVLERTEEERMLAEDTSLNAVRHAAKSIGVICYGAAYQHVRSALADASILKLGVSWPLPESKIGAFAESVDRLYVVEEASSYLHDAVSACGVEVCSDDLPRDGELTPAMIAAAFSKEPLAHKDSPKDLPPRPPSLCAGCPHRPVFKELSRLKAIVTGDIGCYTLGALPPLSSMDTCVDMGASISMAHGFELALEGDSQRPVVAVIGDSTFGHSGLSSLLSTCYNQGSGTVCILDNRTTAMTGRQGNPFNGVTLQDRETFEVDLEALVRAAGAKNVDVIDPNDVMATRQALKAATSNADELNVIIFKSPCILLSRERKDPFEVNGCRSCGVCISLGCPAIAKETESGYAYIDPEACIGCGQCAQYCKFDAIARM